MNYYALDEALTYLENDKDIITVMENQVASIIELSNDPIFNEFEAVSEGLHVKTSAKIGAFLKKLLEKIKALLTKAAYAVAQFADSKIHKYIKGTIPESVKTLKLYNIADEDFEKSWDKYSENYDKAVDKWNEDVNREIDDDDDEDYEFMVYNVDDKYHDLNNDRYEIMRAIKDFQQDVSNIAKNKTDIKITDNYAKNPKTLFVDYTYTINFNYKPLLTSFNKMNKIFEKFAKDNLYKNSDSMYYNNRNISWGLSALTSIGFNMLKMGVSNAVTILKACK